MRNRFTIDYRLYTPTGTTNFITAPDDEIGDGINRLTLSFQHNGYEHYSTAATSSFEIRGDFYAYVFYWLWQDVAAQSNSIELRIYDNQCEKWLNGFYYIKPAGIEFCADCVLSVQAKYEDRTLECFKNTLIDTDQSTNPDAAHDWFSGGLQHPTFSYCKNKGWLYPAGALVVWFTFLIPILGILLLLIAASWFQRIYEQARGCERKNAAPYITTYLQNLIDNCGVTLLSDTVFTTPTKLPELNKATIFYMPNKRGIYFTDNTPLYRLENALNWSGERFMQFLKKRFNLKWRLNPTGLLIKHFDEPFTDTPLLDLRKVEKCCTWIGDRLPSYGDYDFQQDSLDTEGNAARRAYNDIVEFNSPYNSAQSGSKKVLFDDAAAGFRNDGLRSDDISQWDSILNAVPLTAISNLLVPLQNADDFVLMSGDNTVYPKVIIHDANTPLTDAKAIKKQFSPAEIAILQAEGYEGNFTSQYGKQLYFYNYIAPANWELNAVTPNTAQLFECDNPRLCECRRNLICEYKLPNCDCELLETLGIYEDTSTGAIIDYPVIMDNDFIGELRNIDIDFGSNTVTLKAVPVGCLDETTLPDGQCVINITDVTASECVAGNTTVTVNFTSANTNNVIVTVGAGSVVISADTGTANVTMPADGTTVAVTVQSVSDEECMTGTFIELPAACSECLITVNSVELPPPYPACSECDCGDRLYGYIANLAPLQIVLDITIDGVTYPIGLPANAPALITTLNALNTDVYFHTYIELSSPPILVFSTCEELDIDINTNFGNIIADYMYPDGGYTSLEVLYGDFGVTGAQMPDIICRDNTCNSYQLFEATIAASDNFQYFTYFNGGTYLATPFTPPAPIAATDTAGMIAFLNSCLPNNISFNYYLDGGDYKLELYLWCNNRYELPGLYYPIAIFFDSGLVNFLPTGINVPCSEVAAISGITCQPNACGCNPDGTVDLTVNWSAVNTSAFVNITAGSVTVNGIAANAGTHVINVPANGDTITVTITDANNGACFGTYEITLPTCEAECNVTITDASVILCESDAYQVWVTFFPKAALTHVESMTVNGITYTPPAPILSTDFAALNAYFDSVSDDYIYFVDNPTLIGIGVITRCGTTISGASFTYTKPDTTTGTQALNFNGVASCFDVQAWRPEFECDNGCNEDGEVGIQVTWTTYGTSGVVEIDAGGLNSIIVPAVFGSAVITVPANGDLITLYVCDIDNSLCCDSVQIQLPDCE